MSHTPGPWYPSFHQTICIGVQNSPDGYTQMICNSILPDTDEKYELEREEIESNMTLIAAAPELLEALEISLRTLKNTYPLFSEWPEYRVMSRAINKAKGL